MKQILFKSEIGFGNSAWVEKTAYGAFVAKADFHPDDPITTLVVGSVKQCFRAVSTVTRSMKNNRLGRMTFSNP